MTQSIMQTKVNITSTVGQSLSKATRLFCKGFKTTLKKLSKTKYVDVQGLTLWGTDLHSYEKAAGVIH